MSKIIKSTNEVFTGTVTIPDRLTMPQVLAWERAIMDGQLLGSEEATPAEVDAVVMPVMCEIVEEWNLYDVINKEALGDLTAETFPGSPRIESAKLIGWIVEEIGAVYNPPVSEE